MLKDSEGYRAFDLYNTTVEDTMPNKRDTTGGFDLYSWGTNRHVSCLKFWVPSQWCSVIAGTPPWATAILMTVSTPNRLSLSAKMCLKVPNTQATQSPSNCNLHWSATFKCQGCIPVREVPSLDSSADPLELFHSESFLNSRNHRRIHHWHPRLWLC